MAAGRTELQEEEQGGNERVSGLADFTLAQKGKKRVQRCLQSSIVDVLSCRRGKERMKGVSSASRLRATGRAPSASP